MTTTQVGAVRPRAMHNGSVEPCDATKRDRADALWGPRPQAAVLDTCFLSHGRFNEGTIRSLARQLRARGVELWIPEQVILEFAIHAFNDHADLTRALNRLRAAGLSETKPLQRTPGEIAEHIRARCADMKNVVVLDMNAATAAAAIRDQILGEGAGSVTKDGVRTGAVDSSIFREAIRRSGENLEQVAFLTENVKDFTRAANSVGLHGFRFAVKNEILFTKLGPPLRSHWGTSEANAFKLVVSSLLADMKAAGELGDRHHPAPKWIAVSDITLVNLNAENRYALEEMVDREAEVDRFATLIGVRDVSVDSDDDPGEEFSEIVSYTAILLADVRIDGGILNNDGNTVHRSEWIHDAVVVVEFEAELNDGELGPARQIGAAKASPANEGFGDAYDAFAWVVETLDGWCGIRIDDPTPDNADNSFPRSFVLRGPNGLAEEADAMLCEDPAWTLSFINTDVEISATEDGSCWIRNEGESFYLIPPARLQSEISGRATGEPYSAIGAVWRRLAV